MCIFITLPESILGVYQFSCVDACIPLQYECIDTNELYFYRILYYRDFTSRYISYRIVYSILIGAGYICIYIFICMYMRIYLCVYVYICFNACECMLLCIHDYMYVFYVCSFYVCWFYDFFFNLWLLGQRWPNKEVQTNVYSEHFLIEILPPPPPPSSIFASHIKKMCFSP